MTIAIGADHAGFALKEQLRQMLGANGHRVIDKGTHSTGSCDYPDFAYPVAVEVASGNAERGVLVCSTGVGMSIAANKVRGIRAALGTSANQVRLTRSHNNANVLTLGARYLDFAAAQQLVEVFLSTTFDEGRHQQRLAKIAALEEKSR
jgi:ribose 5-phosphate isomerase B